MSLSKSVVKKKLTDRAIRSVAEYLETYTVFGEPIRLLDILRELERKGYGTFYEYPKHSKRVREVLQKMGWKISALNQ